MQQRYPRSRIYVERYGDGRLLTNVTEYPYPSSPPITIILKVNRSLGTLTGTMKDKRSRLESFKCIHDSQKCTQYDDGADCA